MLSLQDHNAVEAARVAGKKIVLATGVFDLLHQEHKRFLQKAKAVGDFLVVGVESDVRVKQMKGEGRPINSQEKRVAQIRELGFVDVVFVLPEEFSRPEHHRQLLAEVRPAVLAVSSHTAHQDKKRVLVAEYGGELRVVHQHNPKISTTLILSHQATQS